VSNSDPVTGGALHGTRVVEVGLLVQGPQAAATLGQLGAEVIKVELPGFGDRARWLPLAMDDWRSAYFLACNRSKRSLALDLRVPAGKLAFLRLLESADVLITNFTPGTMEQWGLGYDDLAVSHPRLVYCSGSAFGTAGPDADRAGADLSAQASSGLLSGTMSDGGEPRPIAVTIADHIASQNVVAGVLAALIARSRTGRGQRVDVSLLGSLIWAQASEYTYYLLSGRLPGNANRSNPMIAGIYGVFPTADGWLAVVGIVDRSAFYAAIGRPDLGDDPRFASPLLSEEQKPVLFAILDDVFRTRPTADWCAVLGAADQRYAVVRDYAEVVADPQAWANGYLLEHEDGDGRRQTIVGTPIAMSMTPTAAGGPAPELGQHTEEVLLELGYTWEDISMLRLAGAV
jgi:crotonobetainyl-CoA:carnitine CoA-transferase CaiB-like acyl-CoA transferase